MRYGGLRHTDNSLRSRIATRTRAISSLLRHYAWMPAGLTLATAIGAGLLHYPAVADGQPDESVQPVSALRGSEPQEASDSSPTDSDTNEQDIQQNAIHVTVNGTSYDVPENGQIHDDQAKDKSRTSVDISNSSSQNKGTSTNSNSTTLHISTQSTGNTSP